MSSVLERYNQIYQQFLDDLNKTFQVKNKLKPDEYLEDFTKHILPFMDNVSVCNEDFFKMSQEPVLHVSHNISFRHIFNHKEYQLRKSKISFWKYLHTLYLLSTKLNSEINELVSKFKEDKSRMIKLVLSNQNDIIDNLKKYKPETVFLHDTFPQTKIDKKKQKELQEINESLDEDENPGNDFFENSLIGQLANDLSSKVNPEDFKGFENTNPMDLIGTLFSGMSGGTGGMNNLGGLGNILGTIVQEMGQKMESGELDHQKLFTEAQQMMGGIFGGMPPMPPTTQGGMDPNMLRQMGFQHMMNQMAQQTPHQNVKPKNQKKKVIRRKRK